MTSITSYGPYRFPTLFLTLVIVLLLHCGIGWGQQTAPRTGSQSSQSIQALQALQAPAPGPMQLDWYIASRYSIYGPASLSSVDSKTLAFPGGYGIPGVTISLANKSVSVMNEAGATVSFTSLKPGTRVVVCDRSDSVVVFTITTTPGVGNVQR